MNKSDRFCHHRRITYRLFSSPPVGEVYPPRARLGEGDKVRGAPSDENLKS